MKREIKFRAWCKDEKRMFQNVIVGGNVVFLQYNLEVEDNDFELVYYTLDNIKSQFEVMQFTSLYDKNGKEIYEGDIVVVKNKEEKTNDHMQGTGVVGWYQDDLHFGFSKGGSSPLYLLTWFGTESIEVIGNIYENPELLK